MRAVSMPDGEQGLGSREIVKVLKVDGPKRDTSELNGLRPGRSNRRDQGGQVKA
jgi:hypothetical protein